MPRGPSLTQEELERRAAPSFEERPRPKEDPVGYAKWWRARVALGLPTTPERNAEAAALRRRIYVREKVREHRRKNGKGKTKTRRKR